MSLCLRYIGRVPYQWWCSCVLLLKYCWKICLSVLLWPLLCTSRAVFPTKGYHGLGFQLCARWEPGGASDWCGGCDSGSKDLWKFLWLLWNPLWAINVSCSFRSKWDTNMKLTLNNLYLRDIVKTMEAVKVKTWATKPASALQQSASILMSTKWMQTKYNPFVCPCFIP